MLNIEGQLGIASSDPDRATAAEWYNRVIRALIEEVRAVRDDAAELRSKQPLKKTVEGVALVLSPDEHGNWAIEAVGEGKYSYSSYSSARTAFDQIRTLEDLGKEFYWDEARTAEILAQCRPQ